MIIFLTRERSPMNKIFKFTLFFYLLINIFNISISSEKFFNKALELYENKKYEDARFMFERNIVFNPKHSKSYLYLAKIFKIEENEKEEEKNLNTTLLLEPDNEEAMYMLIDIELKRSNFSKVKELNKNFKAICSLLCDKISLINKRLNDIEAKKES